MARAVLLAGAVACGLGAAGALVVAIIGVDRLLTVLPPLSVDADAVRAVTTVMAVGLGVACAVHAAVLLGLVGRRRRAWSAGILLAALLTATLVALSAAAFTSAVRSPDAAVVLVAAGLVAGLGALAYGVAAWLLAAEVRAGAPV